MERLRAQQLFSRQRRRQALSACQVPVHHVKDGDHFRWGRPGEASPWCFFRFCRVQPNPLDRDCLLDDAQHRGDLRAEAPGVVKNGLHRWMIHIDPISDAVSEMLRAPSLDQLTTGNRHYLSTMGKNSPGPFASVFGQVG